MNIQTTHEVIEQALSFIPAQDRDTWLKVGMAVKAAFGENGFTLWDCWSQSAENYCAQAAKDVWRSLKVDGGVTIGSLMYVARGYGYRGSNCPVNATRHQPVPVQSDPQSTKRNRQKFGRWLQEAFSLNRPEADLGRHYIKARGLDSVLSDLPHDWRFHPALDYWHEVNSEWVSLGCYPALIGVIRGPDGKGCGIHRTYLDRDGRKLKLTDPVTGDPLPAKKTMSLFTGATNGAAIRLYPAEETLAVAEGVETALAARIATGYPVWATVSAGGMARLEVPEQVQEVAIMVDLDRSETGEKAAKTLAVHLLNQGVKSRIVLPSAEMLKAYQDQYACVVRSLDWCDVLNTEVQHG